MGNGSTGPHAFENTPDPKDPMSTPTGEILDVGPEQAEQWLSRNPNNRNLRRSVVESYARDMTAGTWRLNGETVKLRVQSMEALEAAAATVQRGLKLVLDRRLIEAGGEQLIEIKKALKPGGKGEVQFVVPLGEQREVLTGREQAVRREVLLVVHASPDTGVRVWGAWVVGSAGAGASSCSVPVSPSPLSGA